MGYLLVRSRTPNSLPHCTSRYGCVVHLQQALSSVLEQKTSSIRLGPEQDDAIHVKLCANTLRLHWHMGLFKSADLLQSRVRQNQ